MMSSESVQKNLLAVLQKTSGKKLIAVSKFQPISLIEAVYRAGQQDFGENFVQELREKKKSARSFKGYSLAFDWHSSNKQSEPSYSSL